MNLFSLTPEGQLNNKSRERISVMFRDLLSNIEYKIISGLPHEYLKQESINDNNVRGAYDEKEKIIYISSQATIKDFIHEIGHAVHYQLFNCKQFELSSDNKSDYAHTNYREDFAEAFCDLVWRGSILTIRDKQIHDIIKNN